jgi:hypothetical protein
VLAIAPASGHVSVAGRLPSPLSDAGVAADGATITVAGGRTAGGTVTDRVLLLRTVSA